MNPIIYEKVRDHINNGTADLFLDRIEEIVNTQELNTVELQHLHFFCFVLILNKKYPKATILAMKLSQLRQKERQRRTQENNKIAKKIKHILKPIVH